MKTKHTPGPWKISRSKEFIGSEIWPELFTPRQATSADIRLVNAAPDMLEALNNLLTIIEEHCVTDRDVWSELDDNRLNNALAVTRKAKGQ